MSVLKASGNAFDSAPNESSDSRHSALHPKSRSPSNATEPPEKVCRKVSFSNMVVTSLRVEESNDNPVATSHFRERVSIEECRSVSPVSETGHDIQVDLLDPAEDELTCDTALAQAQVPVFEVKLGMVKQATVYNVEFTVPHELPQRGAELLRFIDQTPGRVSAPVNVGANIELISCEPNESGPGHRLLIKMSTTKQHKVNEFFTLRLIDSPKEAVHLVLHGLSLGRGQGTPFLRLGIHRISHNSDFEESDEFTEWPGFTRNMDEDIDADNSQNAVGPDKGDQMESSQSSNIP